jgi:Flp pilus assembly pilin Flp
MPELIFVRVLADLLWTRLAFLREERGSPTVETVLITAGLAALAIATVAIIVSKVTRAANDIPTR